MRLLIFIILSISMTSTALRVGFYDTTCPQAESIVRDVVRDKFKVDRTITAALLRLHFHDCWVNGCDASILLNSTIDNKTEKDNSTINGSLWGFNIIDDIKTKLEEACPSTVSCSDIISLAVRDGVALAGGLNYSVPTGRRDGNVSLSSLAAMPTSDSTVEDLFSLFLVNLGVDFTLEDIVVLFGAHTVGKAHCKEFSGRLSNAADPMDPALKAQLTKQCNTTVGTYLDQVTPLEVDNQYYTQISQNRGILQVDQTLASHTNTSKIVERLSKNNEEFARLFAAALVKLGNSRFLEGEKGEIRKECGAVNTPSRYRSLLTKDSCSSD